MNEKRGEKSQFVFVFCKETDEDGPHQKKLMTNPHSLPKYQQRLFCFHLMEERGALFSFIPHHFHFLGALYNNM